MSDLEPILPDKVIISKTCLIWGQKVMVDSDLALLYEVGTKVLKQAVKREFRYFSSAFYV
jgi:hypothetical protein